MQGMSDYGVQSGLGCVTVGMGLDVHWGIGQESREYAKMGV